MTLLIASLAALLFGPPLLKLASGSPWALRLLDGFVYVAIGGLVLLHVLPEVVATSGWAALVAAAIGLVGPSTIEKRLEQSARQAHEAALLLAVVALSLHGLFDGMALTGEAEHHAELGLAVVLHRLPVGLTLWWLIQPTRGTRAAAGALGAIAVATVAGFFLGGAAAGALEAPAMGLVYALVAGSLLHVVLHRPHPVAEGEGPRFGRADAAIGAAMGALLLLFLHRQRGDDDAAFWGRLLELSLESAPALLFAYAAAGAVQAFLPKATVGWMGRGGSLSQAGRGVAFGLPLPICSCGVVPVYRSLVVQGAPPAAAMAFLVATPELGLDAVLLSVPLLGPSMTLARVVAAAAVALAVGAIVGKWAASRGLPEVPGHVKDPLAESSPASFGERVRQAFRTGYGEVVDETAPWILAGLVVAAAMQPVLDAGWLQQLGDGWEVLVFAVIGMPLYVCASGATPLVAVLVAGGISPGAGIALLLSGPATNVTTFGVLSALHGRSVAVAFGAAMLGACVTAGLAVNGFFPDIGGGAFSVGGHEHSQLHYVALALLVVVCALSLGRQGPRGFFGQVLAQGLDHDHDHDHDHEHEDEDGHGHGCGHGGHCC
ncbi:MAG: hypothetical protein GY898_00765 [Proteobacteria bacterium]|nr:hypothetical protein [Pseudomonadota bacterium]